MFEGKPPSASGADKSVASSQAGEQLHALSWSDLVAKLEAARDLRNALSEHAGQMQEGQDASFNAHCAHHLAGQQESFPANNELAVNPLDSGNRKDTCGKEGLSTNENDRVFRGRT